MADEEKQDVEAQAEEPQARGVLERSRRRLEAQVEQLLAPLGESVLELVVAHVS